jgi:hypothetical protein
MNEPLLEKERNTAFSWIGVIIAVVLAFPFGWGLGVCVAYLVSGKDFGQLPILTVPVCLVASVAFAVIPVVKIKTRLAVLIFGIVAFVLIGWLMS